MENGLGGSPSPHLANYVSLAAKPHQAALNHLQQAQQFSKMPKGEQRDFAPLSLDSPGGGEALQFAGWSGDSPQSVGMEIMDAIRLTIQHINELSQYLLSRDCRLVDLNPKDYDEIARFCAIFNEGVAEYLEQKKQQPEKGEYASKELLKAIITRSYNKAVDNEKALNKHYEAFSSQTYGETSYERMQMILDEIQPKESDVFVDLGSGVGQLIVHGAGASKMGKSVGIEIAQLPSKFADVLAREFKKWMNWYGKKYGPFELEHGDFMSEKYRELITQEATVIFINNYAFQSDLETRILRELLVDLKHGTKIISTKPYVPVKGALRGNCSREGSVSEREVQKDNFSVIVDITELNRCSNPPCSWTSAHVPYYLQTINRTKLSRAARQLRKFQLERYFENKKKNRGNSDGGRHSSTPSSSSRASASNSRESSVGYRDVANHADAGGVQLTNNNVRNGQKSATTHQASRERPEQNGGEEIKGYGPTTRRKWMEYVGELEQKRRKGVERPANATTSSNPANSTSKGASVEPAIPESTIFTATTTTPLPATPLTAREFVSPSVATSSGRSNHISPLSHKSLSASSLSVSLNNTFSFDASNDGNMGRDANNSSNALSSPTPSHLPMTPSAVESTAIVGLLNLADLDCNVGGTAMGGVQCNVADAKRKPRRPYERKEKAKAPRGRPRKADRSDSSQHIASKQPRLSDEAREGIDIMHQMTRAVASGCEPIDAARFLSDLKSPKRENISSTTQITQFPFPGFAAAGCSTTSVCGSFTSSKYPELERFLDGMRSLYERFMDSIVTGAPPVTEFPLPTSLYSGGGDAVFAQSTSALNRQQKQFTPVKLPSEGSPQHPYFIQSSTVVERAKKLNEHYQRLRIKSSELQSEITSLQTETEQLVRDLTQSRIRSVAPDTQHDTSLLSVGARQPEYVSSSVGVNATPPLPNATASFPFESLLQQVAAANATQQQPPASLDQLMMSQIVNFYTQQQQQQQLPILNQLIQQLGQSTFGPLPGGAAASAAAANADPLSLGALLGSMNSVNMNSNGSAAAPTMGNVTAALTSPKRAPTIQPPALQNFLDAAVAGMDLSSLFGHHHHQAQGTAADHHHAHSANTPLKLPFSPPSSINCSLAPSSSLLIQRSHDHNSSMTQIVAEKSPNHHQSTVAAVVAAVASAGSSITSQQPSSSLAKPAKKSRTRAPKQTTSCSTTNFGAVDLSTAAIANAACTPKKSVQNVKTPTNRDDPEKAEEIERQIKRVVSIALEVDEAAKSAEKERKAKIGEKRGAAKPPIYVTSVLQSAADNNPIPTAAGLLPPVSQAVLPTASEPTAESISIGAALKVAAGILSHGGRKPRGAATSLSNFIPTTNSSTAPDPDATGVAVDSFSSSAANAAAKLLSTASSSSSGIAITAVAPPPHSPIPDMSAIGAAVTTPASIVTGTSAEVGGVPQRPPFKTPSNVYVALSSKTKLESAFTFPPHSSFSSSTIGLNGAESDLGSAGNEALTDERRKAT